MQVLYLAIALLVYLLTAAELLRSAWPESFREAAAAALVCAVVASVWPLALVWRGLLGGGPGGPGPMAQRVGEKSFEL